MVVAEVECVVLQRGRSWMDGWMEYRMKEYSRLTTDQENNGDTALSAMHEYRHTNGNGNTTHNCG